MISNKILISPPFGSYLNLADTTSIIGTYTWEKRPGRFSQTLITVRPIKGGWVNQMGFRNPGIKSITFNENKILSIVGMDTQEWDELFTYIPSWQPIEINLGCPNNWTYCITDPQIQKYLDKFRHAIIKLPPTPDAVQSIKRYIDLGAKSLHLFNTLPTKRGGESGRRVREYNLSVLPQIRAKFPKLNIIAGGGIYSLDDLMAYEQTGANQFSLASIFFNPIKAAKVLKDIKGHFETSTLEKSAA